MNIRKSSLWLVLITLSISTAGCKKDAKTSEQETKMDLLSKSPWYLKELSWTTTNSSGTITRLSYSDLLDCQRKSAYKFSKWIVAPADDVCLPIEKLTGEFELSEDGTLLESSLFTGGLQHKLIYSVDTLNHDVVVLTAKNARFNAADAETQNVHIKFTMNR